MFLIFLLILSIIIHHQVLFLSRVHVSIDRDGNCLQSNNNVFSNNLWLLFSSLFFFLKVWFNKSNNIKLRVPVILIVYVLLFLHKHIKTPHYHEAIRSCSRHKLFTFGYTDNCEDILSLITQLVVHHFSISKLKCKNLSSLSLSCCCNSLVI